MLNANAAKTLHMQIHVLEVPRLSYTAKIIAG